MRLALTLLILLLGTAVLVSAAPGDAAQESPTSETDDTGGETGGPTTQSETATVTAPQGVPDFRVGLQGGDNNDAGCGQTTAIAWSGPVSTSSGTGDVNDYEMNCMQVHIENVSTTPLGQDFRICYDTSPGTGRQCTPWASESAMIGGNWGQWAGKRGDVSRANLQIEKQALPQDKIITSARLMIQVADHDACNGYSSPLSTPALTSSTTGGGSGWPTHTWQNLNCFKLGIESTLADKPRVTDVRVNKTDVVENEPLTLSCRSNTPGIATIRPNVNDTRITFTPQGWNGDGINYTFLAGPAGHLRINCTIGDEQATARTVDVRVRIAPPAQPTVTGEVLCAAGKPYVKLDWDDVPGAVNYTLHVNNSWNWTGPDSNFTLRAKPWLEIGKSHNFSVRGNNSQGTVGPPGNITLTYAACPQTPTVEVPDAFERAYFAKAGTKRVAAYWTADEGIIIYENFATNLSTYAPTGTHDAVSPSLQTITLDVDEPSSLAFWQRFTTGLRLG